MLRAFLLGIILGVILVVGGAWYYFTSGRAPVAVSDPAMPFEKRLAKGALHARIDKDPHTDPPPVPLNESTYMAGADIYKEHCAVCHGLPDQQQSAIALGMFPQPPTLFKGTGVTDDPAWESYWKAKNGIRLSGMPSFKDHLNDNQLWQVSVLLANADKISPAVKTQLASPPTAEHAEHGTEHHTSASPPPTKK